MLTKLIKYEWKALWKVTAAMNCFLILVTLLGMFSFRSTILGSDIEALNVLGVLTLLLYYLSIIVVSFAVMIYVSLRFYRNLYGDEGYLMHTLPVTATQHVISKLLVSVFCYLITMIVIFVSIISLAISFVMAMEQEYNVGNEIRSAMAEVMPMIQAELSMPIWLYVVLIVIGFIVSCFSAILMIYAAISIGQMFGRHKVMGSIISYIGLYIIEQIVMSYIAMPQSINNLLTASGDDISISSILNSTFLSTFIIAGIFGVFYYILTVYLMKRKMNLD